MGLISELTTDFYQLHKNINNVAKYGSHEDGPYGLPGIQERITKLQQKYAEDTTIQTILKDSLQRLENTKHSRLLFVSKLNMLDLRIRELIATHLPGLFRNFKIIDALIGTCLKGDAKMADYLLHLGKVIDCNMIVIPRTLYLSKNASPNYTLLHHACLSENVLLAKVLVKHGANPNTIDFMDLVLSPVLSDVCKYMPSDKIKQKIIKILIDAILKLPSGSISEQFQASVSYFLENPDPHNDLLVVLKSMLKQGYNLSSISSLLFKDAVKRKDLELIQLLIFHGVDKDFLSELEKEQKTKDCSAMDVLPDSDRNQQMHKLIEEWTAIRNQCMPAIFMEMLQESIAQFSRDPLSVVASFDTRSKSPPTNLAELTNQERQLLARRCLLQCSSSFQ